MADQGVEMAVLPVEKTGEVSEEAVEKVAEEVEKVEPEVEMVVFPVGKVPAPAPEAEGTGRMITLKSSDGALIEVAEASARLSKIIGKRIDDGRTDPYILLPAVDTATLEKMIAYCNQHADKKSDTVEEKEYLKNWDKTFIDELAGDTGFLVKVIVASTDFKIDGLLDLASQRVTEAVKEKSLEEILKAFNVSE
ncbi:SKP1-like protein 13 [Oryza brachyantha]|uniref:SKP1 component POZ domain-containing protein n=1 Tax=Oryza brachyantha TaxID=4533 RepID=J3MN48_ORYBR|nr:SKP1-like protein 13 [Oryza brachyantha]